MDFSNLLTSRHSIKSFKDDSIPKEKIQNILEEAALAPSFRNLQSFKLVLISDKNIKEKIKNILPDDNSGKEGFVEAPLSIAVLCDMDISKEYKDNKFYMLDGAIVMYNLLLSITNEGLGSCWIEILEEEKFKGILNVPNNYKVIGLTPIGYIKDTERNTEIIDKKDIHEISYENSWNNKIKYF